ncbi:MAG: nucleotide sugar dehydrogenase [Nevskiales bacterium]
MTDDSRKRPIIADQPDLAFAPMSNPVAQELRERIARREATIAIAGLGYVGLPLAAAMNTSGFRVLGYDVDPDKVEMLKRGKTYLKHLGSELVSGLLGTGRFHVTAEEADLDAADALILCVPTPLGRHREPDMSFVTAATELAARHLRRGQLIVLESTTYPGTTRELCRPLLEKNGLRCGEDFFLAFSPEREDPGRKDFNTRTTPKLVGGVDPVSAELAVALYQAAIQKVIPVESADIAEAAKLLENIYRAVNIALVNELKPVFQDMGIDIWKVIDAAATKPFGFQAFYPGPGLGGHCIPLDPFYLTWRAKAFGHHTRFIELAGEINHAMPRLVVDHVYEALNHRSKPLRGARVMVCGVAYKSNVDDTRETPAQEIITRLQVGGAVVSYHDPHVPSLPRKRKGDTQLDSVSLTAETLHAADVVVLLMHHDAIDWALIAREANVVVDACNAMAPYAPIKGLLVKA